MPRRPEERRHTGLCKPWRLSPDLSRLVGVPVASRTQLNKLLWAYIKRNHLQDARDKRYFYPDEHMTPIFGVGRLRCFAMAKYVQYHLSPL